MCPLGMASKGSFRSVDGRKLDGDSRMTRRKEREELCKDIGER
jgi:hypothetical protein